MNRVLMGLTVLAAMTTAPAATAEQNTADVWIGLENSQDGFLIDEDTGAVWMTGICLNALEPAVNTGTVWTSHTSRMESVGRMQALLTQTFTLDTNAAAPTITVANPARGGPQSFPAVLMSCDADTCDTLKAIPAC